MILFGFSFNQNAYAVSGTISDQISCEAIGGVWEPAGSSPNTCQVNGSLSIVTGETLTVNSSIILEITGSGTVITNSGTIDNSGTINININNSGGTFNNSGGIINNYGTFNNSGSININIDNSGGGTFNNSDGIINNLTRFNNFGSININIDNSGDGFNNNFGIGFFNNLDGSIINEFDGIIFANFGSININIDNSGGIITNDGIIFDNSGFVTNDGSININIDNSGGIINNSGGIISTNFGYLTNDGSININIDNSGGFFTNFGTIISDNRMDNSGGSINYCSTVPIVIVGSIFGSQPVDNCPPIVSFSITPNPSDISALVTFDGTATTDNDPFDNPPTSIVDYLWDLDNDGLYDDDFGVSIQNAFATEGDHTVNLLVTDSGGQQGFGTGVVTVNTVNTAPVALSTSIAGFEDTLIVGPTTAVDVDGDSLTYALVSNTSNGIIQLNIAQGTFTYFPDVDFNGSDSFTFTANDGTINSNTATVSITVNPVNDSPIVNQGISNQVTYEDDTFSFNVPSDSFTDEDLGDVLTLFAVKQGQGSLPSWLSFNSVTEIFIGTPTNDDVGTVTIEVTATDTFSATTSTTFTITVIQSDSDGDGILDVIDTQPLVVSSDFSDGTTSGTITDAGDQTLVISNITPDGVNIQSTAGTIPASISMCGGLSTLDISSGDNIDATCGSVILNVVAGPVEIELLINGEIGTTTLDTGDAITFDDQTFTVTNDGTEDVIIEVNGVETTIGAGESETIDAIPPVITTPGDLTAITDTNQAVATVPYTVTATDDVDGPISPIQTTGLPPGPFPIGTTINTFEATDLAGNTGTTSFTVQVVDAQPPVIVGPGNVVVNTNLDVCSSSNTYSTPSVSDNSGEIITPVLVLGPGPTDVVSLGVANVEWSATDSAGNTATIQFTVTVEDNQTPSIITPSDIVVSIDPGLASAVVTYNLQFGDNCPDHVLQQTLGTASGQPHAIGLTVNAFIITDSSGNSNSVSFAVEVVDNEDPIITAPLDFSIDATGTLTPLDSSDYGTATATDNEGVDTITNDAPTEFPEGDTIITWTAIDFSGNQATTTQTITLNPLDNTPPVFNGLISDNIEEATGPDGAIVNYSLPPATDDSGIPPTVSCDHAPGTLFALGDSTVTCTATDDAGNSATDVFTVTVQDTQSPFITVPADVTLDLGDSTDPRNTGSATAADLADPNPTISFVDSSIPGTGNVIETITRVWTATDSAGNFDSENQILTVIEPDTIPQVTVTVIPQTGDAPLDVSFTCDSITGNAPLTYSWDFDGVEDSTLQNPTYIYSDAGEYTATCTVTDVDGDADSSSITIIVNEPPVEEKFVTPEFQENLTDKMISQFQKKINNWEERIVKLTDRISNLEERAIVQDGKGNTDKAAELRAKAADKQDKIEILHDIILVANISVGNPTVESVVPVELQDNLLSKSVEKIEERIAKWDSKIMKLNENADKHDAKALELIDKSAEKRAEGKDKQADKLLERAANQTAKSNTLRDKAQVFEDLNEVLKCAIDFQGESEIDELVDPEDDDDDSMFS